MVNQNGKMNFGNFYSKRTFPIYYIYPLTPKQNSVVKRSIRTGPKEFYQYGNLYSNLNEQNQKLAEWNEIYKENSLLIRLLAI